MSILIYNPGGSPPVDDLATYAPFVTDEQKDEANIQGFIAQAERLAQGPQGAGRPLEQQLISNELHYSVSTRQDIFDRGQRGPLQSVFLRVWPVVDDVTLIVEARSVAGKDTWGRLLPVTDWVTLESSGYDLETNRGQLTLTASRFYNMLRATYTGGFDFTDDDESEELERHKGDIKHAVGLVLQSVLNAGGARRIKSVSQTTVTYQYRDEGQGVVSVLPAEAVQILARYRSPGV